MVGLGVRVRRRWNVLRAVAFVTYKEWFAYRTHMMVSIFVGPVYFIVQYFIWTAVYGGGGSLHGLELEQMIRYFGASALIGYVIYDSADWNLSMLIRTGRYLTFAMRPLNHRFFALSQKVGHRMLATIFETIPCLLIFILLFRIDMTPAHPGWAAVSIVLAFFMQFYVNYFLGLVSFWIVDAQGLQNVMGILSGVFSGALIPLMFFPHWLQVLQFFLPFQYILYVPSMIYIGSYSLGGITMPIPQIVGLQALAVLLMFLFSEGLCRMAKKRFSDANN